MDQPQLLHRTFLANGNIITVGPIKFSGTPEQKDTLMVPQDTEPAKSAEEACCKACGGGGGDNPGVWTYYATPSAEQSLYV